MIRSRSTITEVAQQVGVNAWTLRRLERLGRIPPARRDPLARVRIYSNEDITMLKVALASLTDEATCALAAS